VIAILAKDNDKWLKYAYSICGNKELSKDLVQDMYLKLLDCKKEIKCSYVYAVIRSIHIDQIRKNKEFLIKVPELSQQEDEPEQINYQLVVDSFDKLKKKDQLIIIHSYHDGQREFCRQSGISIDTVSRVRKKFKQTIWESQKNEMEQGMLSQQSHRLSESNHAIIAKSDAIFLM